MKWLISGANGFLGRHVVARFLDQGDEVRALVRPATDVNPLGWGEQVDVFRGDLRRCPDLPEAFENVDGLVHLAAAVTGGPEEQFAAAVVATEKLLTAMAQSAAKRLVFISSFSVYDWGQVQTRLDESTPLESSRLYERDGYAIAKTWQERVVRQFAAQHDWDLTVLRPGFIWGRGNEWCSGLGDHIGRRYVVIGPYRHLPLTHVVNCADCIAVAASSDSAIGETFNIVDGDTPRAWRFTGDYLRYNDPQGFRVPLPYHLALGTAVVAKGISQLIFGDQGRLPGLFIPRRFVARFKSTRFSTDHLRNRLGWTPPLTYTQCLQQTYGQQVAQPPRSAEKPVAVHV